jgi:hypothetical protein
MPVEELQSSERMHSLNRRLTRFPMRAVKSRLSLAASILLSREQSEESAISFTENFENYPANSSAPYFNNFPKYLNYAFTGRRYWEVRSFGNNKYIQLTANGGEANKAYDTYFMMPIDFTAANSLTFRVNAGFYNGAALKVYTVTNYTPGTEITPAALNEITSSFTMPTGPATGYGTFAPAGTYSFPAGLTGNGFIVFKYEGNSSGIKTTMQLDDITVN